MKEKIKEFKNEDIVIYVETQEEYDKLMQILEENDCIWCSGELPTKRDFFGKYEELCIECDDSLCYGSKKYFENDGYKIITFKEFIGEYKLIDIFNRYVEGKPVNKFKLHELIYTYNPMIERYIDDEYDELFEYTRLTDLNDKIEILEDYEESCEESHKIEPIRIIYGAPSNPLNEVISKLNEVIEELNRRGKQND